ncbi:MAG TPA: TauD/TfdA family dioxygenase [Aldersonia sp.]
MTEDETWQPTEIAPMAFDVSADVAGLTAVASRIDLDTILIRHRALVFRGFDITPATLDAAVDRLLPNRLAYLHGNTPRVNLGDNIYTSTEYPAEQSISMHSELSYAHRWPARLLFYCEHPARSGGATAICDTGRWLASIDPAVRHAFGAGLRYTQNLHSGRGLGRSWQETFETDDRDEVERFLADGHASWSWTQNGLRVTQDRSATTLHSVTGEEVWFNQVDQWHHAGLPGEVRAALLELLTEDEMPQSVTFADGTPIPADHVTHVREMGWRHAVDVDWRAGELLLVDNVLAAHARRSYSGPRRVLVAMSGPTHRDTRAAAHASVISSR